LIKAFGLVGAALATLISISLFNIIKMIFIQIKFRMHPLSIQMVYISLIAALSYFIVYFIPLNLNPIINLLLRSAIFACCFLLPVYYLKISKDLNDVIHAGIKQIKNFVKPT
jgi:hypothetical protein